MPSKKITSVVLIALFILPFFSILLFSRQIENPFSGELATVFSLSILQACLSAALTLALGFFGALGLLSVTNLRWRRVFDFLFLWPSFAPVLLVLVSTLNLFMSTMRFPFGFWGVVILHVSINTGLVAVLIARTLETQLSGVIEAATVEGAGRWQLLTAVARELTDELARLFYFVFVLCFSSFAVPLVVGARTGRTIETLIYEKLVSGRLLGLAIPLSLLQLGLLFLLSSRVTTSTQPLSPSFRQLKQISFRPALFFLLALSLALGLGPLRGLLTGLAQIQANPIMMARLTSGVWGSVFECFFVALLTFVLSLMLLYTATLADTTAERFFKSFTAPSTAVLGLSAVIVFAPETWSNIALVFLLATGFTILIFSTLYRLRLASTLAGLQAQVDSARVLGASPILILLSVVLPVARKDLAFVVGLAAFWASGDFAFGSMVAGRDLTLAIGAHSLLGGYRLEAATAVTLFSLAVGALFFLACEWLGAISSSTGSEVSS